MKKLIMLGLVLLWSSMVALGQPALTNSDIIKLTSAGLSEDFILNLIDQQGEHLTSDVSSLIEMKNGGVNERILTAVATKSPSPEPLNSDSVMRLAKAGFSEGFILDLLDRQPGQFAMDAARIVQLKQAGVGERVLSRMMSQTGERVLPAGSHISVRLIDSIDSEKDDPGKDFQASLADPIMLGDEELVPKGADAVVRLVGEKESGKLTGRTELTVQLVSIRVQGETVPVLSSSVSEYSGSRGARTAKSAAATGAVGAIIGAIAGGGKGAAIGAGAGAAAGAGAQVFMKGQRVRIPSETLLTFSTERSIELPAAR